MIDPSRTFKMVEIVSQFFIRIKPVRETTTSCSEIRRFLYFLLYFQAIIDIIIFLDSTIFFLFSGLEGTDSTTLQRNNTFTTYITLNRKHRLSTYQHPTRTASLIRGSQNANGTSINRKKQSFKDVADEPI